MSTIQTSSYRRPRDHFEPQDTDPQEQRRLRGLLVPSALASAPRTCKFRHGRLWTTAGGDKWSDY